MFKPDSNGGIIVKIFDFYNKKKIGHNVNIDGKEKWSQTIYKTEAEMLNELTKMEGYTEEIPEIKSTCSKATVYYTWNYHVETMKKCHANQRDIKKMEDLLEDLSEDKAQKIAFYMRAIKGTQYLKEFFVDAVFEMAKAN